MKERLRTDRVAQSLGVTDESIDTTPDNVLLGSSEATIVSIVEVYTTMQQVASEAEIFLYLEEVRSAAGQGNLPLGPTIQSYIRYRLSIEHGHGAPINAESLESSIREAAAFFQRAAIGNVEARLQQEGGTVARLLKQQASERELDRADLLDVIARNIIKGYRKLAAARGCAPAESVSDIDILHIYRLIDKVFGRVAEGRGEELDGMIINNIVLFFLQKFQMFGPAFFGTHLEYEAEKYVNFGLREEYARRLDLR